MPRKTDVVIKNNLSIYLVKSEFEEFADVLKNDFQILYKYDEISIAYCERSVPRPPEWLERFFNIRGVDYLWQANSKVVLLKKINIDDIERMFAITFGRGKFLLKDDVVEDQFGLKIVLNSIAPNKIRKIKKNNIGKNFKTSQEQMPKESNIYEFEFDINRDLVKYVTGKSEDELFEKGNITGGDIFNLKIDKNIDNIDEFLIACYERYGLETYRDNFDWIDNIKQVRQKNLIDILNNLLVQKINENDEAIFMAVPEVVSWESISHFKYSGGRTSAYNDIDIQAFRTTFKNNIITSFEQLKSKIIKAISSEDETESIYEWTANKCIFANIDYDAKSYVYNGGKWYVVNTDFVELINNEYNNIVISNINFIDYNHNNENEYNAAVVQSITDSVELHRFIIPYGDTRSRIEPCDVAIKRNFIHIKKNGGSSYLSHLFNQATVSSEAFKEVGFRNRLNTNLQENGMPAVTDDTFNSQAYTITLGIISKSETDRPHIPFFSKVAIRYAKRYIENLGYSFNIKNIKNRQT